MTSSTSVSVWLILLFGFFHIHTLTANEEGDALNALKTNLADPNNVLQSWDPTLIDPCSWDYVTCNNESSVTHVDLGSANLSGQLVAQLGVLSKLQYLNLINNNITGNIPEELGGLSDLVSLDLSLNNFDGTIPATLGNLANLSSLRLSNNSLLGNIPETLTNIQSLQVLDLSNNNLTGDIPVNGSFSLFTPVSFANNPRLNPLPASPYPGAGFGEIVSGFRNEIEKSKRTYNFWKQRGETTGILGSSVLLVFIGQTEDKEGEEERKFYFHFLDLILLIRTKFVELRKQISCYLQLSNKTNDCGFQGYYRITNSHRATNTAAIAGGVVAGAALLVASAALLFAAPAIALAYWRRRKSQDHFFDVPAEEDREVHLGQLKRYSLRELQVATGTFSNKNIIGRGGFGKVYKGCLADGTLVAVKRLKEERTQGGELQFQTEVKMISMAVHRNLLHLHGFCMTPTERLLVYPYMANGSVASCLRDRPEGQLALDWPIRQRIALGSARGLAYLHDHCDPTIIHRDVKAANILLDQEFEAVVGDFGLARLMNYKDTHITTAVRGTIGHIAPEYFSNGRFSEKTDVFGYGVMLLELITGQRGFDPQRGSDDNLMLVDWVKQLLKDRRLETLVDSDLNRNYIDDQVEQLIQVALLCTQGSPRERPKMSEVVQMLEGNSLAERWEERQKEEVFL